MGDLIDRAISNVQSGQPSVQEVVAGRRSTVREFTQVTSTSDNTVAVQKIQSDGGNLESNQQIVNVIVADRDYYFTLEILAESGMPLPNARLSAGISYGVRTMCSLNPNDIFHQRQVKIAREVLFYLEADPADAVDIEAQDAKILVGQPLSWRCTFKLKVRESLATDELVFRLVYREAADTLIQNSAATLRVPANASLTAVVRQLYSLPVNVIPPKNAAFVYVENPGPAKLQINAFCQAFRSFVESTPVDSPKPIEGKFQHAFDYLEKLQQSITQFSQKNPARIGEWFDDVLKSAGDEPLIVIIDESDSRIPWEMFRLAKDRYLGALARVVRWTHIKVDWSLVPFELNEKRIKGRIIAYVQPGDPISAAASSQSLKELLNSALTDLADVRYETPQNPPACLLYLGSGHVLHAGEEEGLLDALWNPTGQKAHLPLEDVRSCDPRPLVFTDSPYSGCVFSKAGQEPIGFPKEILRRLGTGLIGTLAPVDREDATEILEEFVNCIKETGGAPPADLLLKMRRQAEATLLNLASIPADKRKIAKRKALTPFVYVYYGGPHLRVEAE
jgi:hypothetical protein